jgi:GntR family transcriptional regulator
MAITLDFRDREPIYSQIAEQVKARVAAGALKPGDQLPTVRQLAADLRVNFNTVARAYRILHEEGVISTQQGRGTFILDQPIPTGAEQRKLRRAQLAELTDRYLAEAERLGYEPDEILKSVAVSVANRRRPTKE